MLFDLCFVDIVICISIMIAHRSFDLKIENNVVSNKKYFKNIVKYFLFNIKYNNWFLKVIV